MQVGNWARDFGHQSGRASSTVLGEMPQEVDNILEVPMALGQAVGSTCEAPMALDGRPQASGAGSETSIMLDAAFEALLQLGEKLLAMGTFGGDNSGNVVDDLAPLDGTPQSQIP
ncbi:unnamed protein product [Ilex paraguariensis]|uniref:Uncharacterized protein n=1 Tax=Ilex paraguariensis TaxID=185542 RepID=A0ABC8R061_9AQUA